MDTRSRPAPTTLAFHASRIVTDVGVLLVLTAMSLSFVTSPKGSRSAMDLDAFPALILVAPVFLVTLLPDHTRPIPRYLGWGALVLGLAALPYSIVKYLDASVLADTLDGGLGLGARVLVFGTFVTLVGVVVGLTRVWMGLPTGGTPSRRSAITTRSKGSKGIRPQRAPGEGAGPRPQRGETEGSPFVDPLFDSLEIPAAQDGDDLLDALDIPADEPLEDDSEAHPQPDFMFDVEGAVDRVAEDEPGDEPLQP